MTSDKESVSEDDRRLIIDGRRWRRTDPCLPDALVQQLKSHLGRGRSAVRRARSDNDTAALARARHRVDVAKHGLGERGQEWWSSAEADRLARAEGALRELDALED
ncbi:biopolymer transporter Tol [Frondihabitans australicus]|uniref:Biopolymer transporter Tol n=1 Tax=Frondihabitans australicus TaxID=386892 RepID=A0A495IGC4_9MICO|nr:biopolymer transporter Tol [Frondihabitans australicus]RKR74799.1 hypothetical protein C8E83_1929 [Frondihabitans australicus]